MISAWDRVEAYACARKHAAVAEFIRRRAEPGCGTDLAVKLPGTMALFLADRLRESR